MILPHIHQPASMLWDSDLANLARRKYENFPIATSELQFYGRFFPSLDGLAASSRGGTGQPYQNQMSNFLHCAIALLTSSPHFACDCPLLKVLVCLSLILPPLRELCMPPWHVHSSCNVPRGLSHFPSVAPGVGAGAELATNTALQHADKANSSGHRQQPPCSTTRTKQSQHTHCSGFGKRAFPVPRPATMFRLSRPYLSRCQLLWRGPLTPRPLD